MEGSKETDAAVAGSASGNATAEGVEEAGKEQPLVNPPVTQGAIDAAVPEAAVAPSPVTSPDAVAAPPPPPGTAIESVLPGGPEAAKSQTQEEQNGLPGPPGLTETMKVAVESLRLLEREHQAFEQEYIKEWNALKFKYLQKFRPLYSRRHEVLCSEPGEAVAAGEQPNVATIKLPNFWLTALKNHRTLEALIQKHDEPVLRYLEDIRSEWLDDDEQTSFKLIFVFSSNPYFAHESLTKIYNMERDIEGEGVLVSTEGTKIAWSPGRDVTKVTVTKKQRNLKTKQTRIVKDTKTVPSFFDFFDSYDFPTPEQFDQMEADEAKDLEDNVEAEFDAGCIIREKIIPRALGWYMGEEDDEYSEDDSEEDSDTDDDDDSDDSDDSDEDEEDETAPPTATRRDGGRRRMGK